MAKHPTYSVVLTYNEELQRLVVHTIDPNRLAPLVAGRMGVVMADEHDFKLDDEFARQLGVGMLNTIALGQPELKQYMTITPYPLDGSNGARLSMAKHKPHSAALSYIESPRQLLVHTVDAAKLGPLVAGRMHLPVWDVPDPKIDDEFARRFGVGMLNLIALGQPDIEQFMSVTQQPIE